MVWGISLSLQLAMLFADSITQCVNPSGLGLLLCLGRDSWQRFAKHRWAWKHNQLCQHHQMQDFCSMEVETSNHVGTQEDSSSFLKLVLVLEQTYRLLLTWET